MILMCLIPWEAELYMLFSTCRIFFLFQTCINCTPPLKRLLAPNELFLKGKSGWKVLASFRLRNSRGLNPQGRQPWEQYPEEHSVFSQV